MNCAEENSSFLGNDYPEDGGCRLRQHTDSSTRYHVTEDLNLHDHNYGISNLASCKQHTVFFFYFTWNFLNNSLKNVTLTLQILNKTAISATSVTESRLHSKGIKNVALYANLHKVNDKSSNESCPCTPHKGICGTNGQAPCILNLVRIWRQEK